MSSDLNDFVWRYVIINQLLNQMLSCAVIYKFFICFQARISYHVLEHASQGVDSKRRAFEPHLTRFRVFVINRKIERRFIGHHACGPVLFVSQLGVDGAATCVTLVFVHFRFLLSNFWQLRHCTPWGNFDPLSKT